MLQRVLCGKPSCHFARPGGGAARAVLVLGDAQSYAGVRVAGHELEASGAGALAPYRAVRGPHSRGPGFRGNRYSRDPGGGAPPSGCEPRRASRRRGVGGTGEVVGHCERKRSSQIEMVAPMVCSSKTFYRLLGIHYSIM